MRVAIFTDTFLPQINGVTKTLNKLLDYFDENNIDYKVFIPQDGNEEYNSKIVGLFSFRFFLYPECRVALPNYLSIVEQLNDFKPDLIHVVTPFNIGLCGLKYAKTYQIPLVSSYHTNIPQYLTYFNLKFLENISWNFFKWFHSHCEKNYCPSNATLEVLKEHGIKNLEVWGRGIELEEFSPKWRNKELRVHYNMDDKIVFLYVGRMSPEKDLDIFMKVAEQLNHRYMNQIHFLMVGNGPLLHELKEKAFNNMTFTGFKKGYELAQLYASSDVFLFPSSTETYGNVILEAMASSTAVIACHEGGIQENLVDGFNGIACDSRDVLEFYEACEKLITNPALRKLLGENGRKYTLQMTWNRIFDRLVKSYESVIQNRLGNESNKKTA